MQQINVSLILLLMGFVGVVSAATPSPALQAVKLASSITYKAVAGNGFVRAVETKTFKSAQYNKITARLALLSRSSCIVKRQLKFRSDREYPAVNIPLVEDIGGLTELQNEALNILDSPQGLDLVSSTVPEVLINPRPVLPMRMTKRATTYTYQYYIPGGKLGGKSKAAVLMARVRNLMTNTYSFRLLVNAVKNGTARSALKALCACKSTTTFNKFIAAG